MLYTPEKDRQNKRFAFIAALLTFLILCPLFFLPPYYWVLLGLGPVVYWLFRRPIVRRRATSQQPFPAEWEQILKSNVAFFNALNDDGKQHFRQMTKVFLQETRITGIQTEVDDLTRVLVAASGIIPVFGFPNWEYTGLGEVLIYPGRFGSKYETEQKAGDDDLNTLGLVHQNGVMILSQPDLIHGFQNPKDKRNVGIHEFAHLVDEADGSIDGLSMAMPTEFIEPWIDWVKKELKDPVGKSNDIDDYAYTNEAEYFAVLAEYFFESPEVLERKHPQLYLLLQKMFHQDTNSFLPQAILQKPKRVGRNAPCPCGSGKKYKKCCLRNAKKGLPV